MASSTCTRIREGRDEGGRTVFCVDFNDDGMGGTEEAPYFTLTFMEESEALEFEPGKSYDLTVRAVEGSVAAPGPDVEEDAPIAAADEDEDELAPTEPPIEPPTEPDTSGISAQ